MLSAGQLLRPDLPALIRGRSICLPPLSGHSYKYHSRRNGKGLGCANSKMDYPVIGLLHATIGRYTDRLPQLQSTQRTEDPCCRIDERTRSMQGSSASQSFSQPVQPPPRETEPHAHALLSKVAGVHGHAQIVRKLLPTRYPPRRPQPKTTTARYAESVNQSHPYIPVFRKLLSLRCFRCTYLLVDRKDLDVPCPL